MNIAVVSTAIPTRLDLLAENLASVRAQTHQPYCHIVAVDYELVGAARNAARAWAAIPDECEWAQALSDDCLLDENYFERLLPHLDGADVVYAKGRVTGHQAACWINDELDPERLRRGNYIDGNCMYRMEFWRELGGHDPALILDDWDFWLRALDAGGRFVYVDEPLWTYRIRAREGHYNLSQVGFSA